MKNIILSLCLIVYLIVGNKVYESNIDEIVKDFPTVSNITEEEFKIIKDITKNHKNTYYKEIKE